MGDDAACRADVTLLDVRQWAAALFDGGKEVQPVAARGWRGVRFNIRFGDALGILLALEVTLEADSFGICLSTTQIETTSPSRRDHQP